MCFFRASDISRKKKAKFRGVFRGKFAGKKSKFAEKSANFAGFSREKVKIRGKIGRFRGILAEKSQISKDFQGQIHRKFGRFHGKFCQETISKKQPISLFFGGQISLKTINFALI